MELTKALGQPNSWLWRKACWFYSTRSTCLFPFKAIKHCGISSPEDVSHHFMVYPCARKVLHTHTLCKSSKNISNKHFLLEILIGMAGCHHESYLDPFRHIQERVTNLLLGCRRRGTQVSFVILLRSGGSFPSSFVQSSIIKNSWNRSPKVVTQILNFNL